MAAALAAITGCTDDSAVVVFSGEYIEVEVDRRLEICAGQLAEYDRFLEASARILDEPIPGGATPTLHVLVDQSAPDAAIPREGRTGVARESHAWAYQQRPLLHELTHAFSWTLRGPTVPALEEGIAEALGNSTLTASELETVFSGGDRCGFEPLYCDSDDEPPLLPFSVEGPLDCDDPQTLGYLGEDAEQFFSYRVF